ncbi:cytochrome P450 52E1 [Xylariales sp. PMI_506]|nr:cytochrome P450 52E1 [Xylariales sp. PMI_506]
MESMDFVFDFLSIVPQSYWSKRVLNQCGILREYPHSDPLGLDWALKAKKMMKENRFIEGLAQQLADCGRTHSFRMFMSNQYFIFTDETENIKTILQTRFDDWVVPPGRVEPMSKFLGRHAILVNDGESWAQSRAMMRPAFVRNAVADLPVMDRHISLLIQRIGDTGEKIDLQELLAMMTMDLSSDFLFGHSTNTLQEATPEDERFSHSFTLASVKVSQAARNGPITKLFPDRETVEVNKFSRDYVAKYMRSVMADMKDGDESGHKYMFLPEMANKGSSFENTQDQLMTLFLAGRDTSNSAMSYVFWHLARRPDVVKKIQEEIELELGDQEPTWEVLRNLKYLNWTIKEALRLNPPLPINARAAARDTILPVGGGPHGNEPVFCPKGTTVRWISWSTHRDRAVFGDDADEFRPERWQEIRPTWDYLPFSGGPRICIGQQFALTQMALVILRLLQHFKTIKAEDDKPPELQLGITSLLKNGCWVSLHPA